MLEAAARILERDGFEGYTTNAIAERAGVSIGSLYQYFPGKDAVTVALIERESAVLLADASATPFREGREVALKHLIRAAVAHQMSRPRLARLLDFEEGRLPIQSRIRLVADAVLTALIRILRESELPLHNSVEVVAFDVLAIVKGMVDAAGEREERNAQNLEARVGRAVFGYLGIR